MATLDGNAAIARMRSLKRNTFAACLYTVWQAYGFPSTIGKQPGRSFATAVDSYNYTTKRHAGDWNPPAGVPVWFGASPTRTDTNKNAGDIGISVGDGKAIFTDYADSSGVHNTYIGVMTLQDRAKEIERPYLGWTEDFGGNKIKFAKPATKTSTKGTKVVKWYHYQDRVAKPLAPGASVNMKKGSSLLNIVGGVGTYSLTPHVYIDGLGAGDAVDLVLVWRNKKHAKDSNHYVERLVADNNGQVRATREFKHSVVSGDQVFIRVTADRSNKGTGTVTLIDSDTYLYN